MASLRKVRWRKVTLAGVLWAATQAPARAPRPDERQRSGREGEAGHAARPGAGRGGSHRGAAGASGQRRRELGGRGEPVGRQLLERGEDGVLDFLGHALALPAERGRLLGHHLGDDRLRGAAGERRVADQHLVGHAAERVDVGPGGDLALAHRLLGRHVVRRAERSSRSRSCGWRPRSRRRARCRSRRPAREPSWSRMFSGLMSRWITPWRWA